MNHFTLPELVDYISTIDARAYQKERNYIGKSTRLSEYITRGAISLPRVKEIILENNTESAAYKLINELTWREYWHSVWRARGDDIFDYIRPQTTPARSGIPTAVLNAATGIEALDRGIRELYETGYIHNHMRMWIAGLVCNIAQCDWKTGAAWMHSYLIDGDFASNHLSWQWVAGCYTGKQYLPQQDNINTYTATNQQGTYLDQPYSVIADMAVPPELVELTTVLPRHSSRVTESNVSIEELQTQSEILLYSPWTLDPLWQPDSTGLRLLFIDAAVFGAGTYSQNVFDSIEWFAGQVLGIKVFRGSLSQLAGLQATIRRKSYPGIDAWPGQVDAPELLFPGMPNKFYPSFSAFWKQAQQ